MSTLRISRHRFLSIGLQATLATAAASILSACGSAPASPVAPTKPPATTPSTSSASAPTATLAPAGQPNTKATGSQKLTLFAANGLSQQEIAYWKQAIIAPYERANPHLTINFVNADTKKLLVDLAGNVPPDVIDIETKNLPSFAMRGAVPDITSRVMSSKVNKDDYSGPDMEKVIFNGKWYGIPWDTAPAVIYYNKKLFDQAGVKYPPKKWGDTSWTWDTFLATAHKLTSGSGPAEVFGWGPTTWWVYWMPWVWGNGGDFADATGAKVTLTEPAFQEAFAFYANLILKEKVAPSPAQSTIGVSQMFYTGKIAMMSSGSYFSVGLDKSMGTNWDIAPYPMRTKVATRAPSDCHTLAKNSPNPDEAWKLVLWLTGPEGQKAYALGGYTPVLKSALNNDAFLQPTGHVNKQVIAQTLIEGFTHHTPLPVIYPQVNQLFSTPMNDLLRGSKPVEQILGELQPQIQNLLAKVPEQWRGVA